jgi:hypothetical protein
MALGYAAAQIDGACTSCSHSRHTETVPPKLQVGPDLRRWCLWVSSIMLAFRDEVLHRLMMRAFLRRWRRYPSPTVTFWIAWHEGEEKNKW